MLLDVDAVDANTLYIVCDMMTMMMTTEPIYFLVNFHNFLLFCFYSLLLLLLCVDVNSVTILITITHYIQTYVVYDNELIVLPFD